ncbi:MAG: SURF1 family protein [bacterium]|nr:SURF1 family protein [bacterium]
MFSLLRTRRWLGFTIVVVVSITAFGLLSLWQWHRAEDKREQRIELQNALAATPLPLDDVSITDGAIEDLDQWRHVTVSGTYLPSSQVLVRKRPLDAHNGFWAMAALREADGTVVWVNRGWLPTAGDALSTPIVGEPPSGTVDVTGYLRPFEDADPDANIGLPAGQIAAVAPALLPTVSEPFSGYIQLQVSVPAEDELTALPLPDVDESRNISYAVQWLIFAFVAVGGWFFFLRREAIEDRQRSAVEAQKAGA